MESLSGRAALRAREREDAASRAGDDSVFIVGCPRSGTTWVQLLLSKHPGIVTAPETQVFAFYLDAYRKQWAREQVERGDDGRRGSGLSRLLSDEEFSDLCRTSARFVLDKIYARDPSASVVVEKSPRHALLVEWIRSLFPEARFLHVIRDPRDVTASLMAAGRTWARWAPRNAVDAARMWQDHVTSARAASGGHYLEVRYEDLRSDPVSELGRILQWMGLETNRSRCEEAVEACALEKLQREADGSELPIPSRKSPQGFFRKGRVGGWQNELSRTQVGIIEAICSEAMRATGYEITGDGATLAARGRIALHDGLVRVRDALDWQLEKLTRRI